MDLGLTPVTGLMEIVTNVTKNVSSIWNAAICAAGRAAVNFFCSTNSLSSDYFATSCVLGTIEAVSSESALASNALGMLVLGLAGTFGARAFNRLGKYLLHVGNITNGSITNLTGIAELLN